MDGPLITGSFIDIQHVNNWDAIVADMHEVGIDTVILTGCAIWGRPLYPANRETVGIQLPMACPDPVGAIVRAADRRGMGVYLGLGAFGRYSLNANPDLSPEHDTWLGNMAEDLRDRYGAYEALRGFYITAEAHGIKEGGLFAQDDCDKTARFVQSIRERVGNAKLVMSPANLKKPRPEQPAPLQRQLQQLDVDIFAYQDHAGFEKVYKDLSFTRAAEGYALIRPLHEKLGQQMWVNCEVFEYTEKRPDGRRVCTSCAFERLERQLRVAAPIADKLVIYQYQGLMNSRSRLVNIGAPGAEALHDAYVSFRAAHR